MSAALPETEAVNRDRDDASAIRRHAGELGFAAVGFARAVPLDIEHGRYRAFIAEQYHGEMAYLAAHAQARLRVDGESILPGAKTVICVTRRYQRSAAEEAADPPIARHLARYARGRDYHGFLRRRLRKLARFVRALGDDVAARAFVDTAPLLERAWAARSGLGFVGKNGLVIVPGQGSYCLLGEIVTTLQLCGSAYGTAMSQRCGSCTACLDACPTGAFVAPFVLDARRCISYQTIERRSVAREPGDWGERLFGCDACQEACPYNRVAPRARSDDTEPFAPLERYRSVDLRQLAALDEAAFARLTEGSPVRRATRRTFVCSVLRLAARRLKSDPGDADASDALATGRQDSDAEVAALAATLLLWEGGAPTPPLGFSGRAGPEPRPWPFLLDSESACNSCKLARG